MANRHTLHNNKLDAFKQWLASRGIETRPGKGDYQVLQVNVPNVGWKPIYKKMNAKEHLSYEAALGSLVYMFIHGEK